MELGTQIEVRAGYIYSSKYYAVIYLNGERVASGESNKYTFNATNDTEINFIAQYNANIVHITTE